MAIISSLLPLTVRVNKDPRLSHFTMSNCFNSRLQRPAWLLNYKGEGHFVLGRGAQKDWTIRMMQFFDYYLKGTKEPRWMKEGIHLRERGIDQKYDLLKK